MRRRRDYPHGQDRVREVEQRVGATLEALVKSAVGFAELREGASAFAAVPCSGSSYGPVVHGVSLVVVPFVVRGAPVGPGNPIFVVALLASGFSSSSVGTMSGQVVMQGFIN